MWGFEIRARKNSSAAKQGGPAGADEESREDPLQVGFPSVRMGFWRRGPERS